MFVWVWNMLVAYHDVQDLHIHECLYEYMNVHVLGWMFTALYVHVTHTQHTHTVTYTRIHVHTHHTIMNLPHDSFSTKSLSKLGRSIRNTRTNQHFRVKSTLMCPLTLFGFFLSCACMYQCVVFLCLVLLCCRGGTFSNSSIVRELPLPPFSPWLPDVFVFKAALSVSAQEDQTWEISERFSVSEDASVLGLHKSRDASQPVNLCWHQMVLTVVMGSGVPLVLLRTAGRATLPEWICSQAVYLEPTMGGEVRIFGGVSKDGSSPRIQCRGY